MKLSLWGEAALRLVYPETCHHCLTLLELSERALCGNCFTALEELRFSGNSDDRIPFIKEIHALYSYESPARELLHGIKFERKTWLLKSFRPAIDALAAALKDRYDLIVPIPIHRSKLLTREFNQSLLIARLLSRASGIQVREALKKTHSTPLQSALPQAERQINLRGVFKVTRREEIEGKRILLVDDILTTGATAEEAARALKKNSAKSAGLFTIARTELIKGKSGDLS